MSDTDSVDDRLERRERSGAPMRRLFARYGRPHAHLFAAGAVTSVLSHVAGIVPPLVLGIVLDSVFRRKRAFGLPLVPDAWLPTDVTGQFWLAAAIMFLAFLGSAVCHYVTSYAWNAAAQRMQHEIRTDAYDELQRLGMTFFDDARTGELLSVLSNDVNQLEEFLTDGLSQFFRLVTMALAIAGAMIYLNPQLAAIALLPIPVIALLTHVFVQHVRPRYEDVRAMVGSVNSRIENNLDGIAVVKTSTAEAEESERVADASREYLDANWDAITTRIAFFPTTRVFAGLGFGVTFVLGGLWILREPPLWFVGSLTAGQLVTFLLYTERFVWPVSKFGEVVDTFQRSRASAGRVFGLMDSEVAVRDDADADLDVDDGAVEFDGVTFSYEDGEPPVVDDVDLAVEGGETAALVGPTGAGKSTLFKLLLRLYDPDDGAIRIDGTDVGEVSLRSLRSSIGYVGQDPFLFHGTVAENVAYGTREVDQRETSDTASGEGRPASLGADRDEVVEAAKAAQAHEFVDNLPDGYDTVVGERGVKLSGGQRQRVAIARAILGDPEILLLDEATSDVDTETELLIQKSLNELSEDRTTFVIAHRLSTVTDADRIFGVEDGRIVESGTHDELLAADGLYAHLRRVQAGELSEISESFLERASRRKARVESE